MFLKISNFEISIDKTYLIIAGIALLFLLGITAVMVFFAIKYSRKKNPEATQINDNLKVEIIWIISPVLLVFLMYYYGYKKVL